MDEQTKRAADDLLEVLAPLDASARAMFGGYAYYVDGVVVGLITYGRVHVKRSPAEELLSDFATLAPAYDGAKETWRLPDDAIAAHPQRVVDAIAATANALATSSK